MNPKAKIRGKSTRPSVQLMKTVKRPSWKIPPKTEKEILSFFNKTLTKHCKLYFQFLKELTKPLTKLEIGRSNLSNLACNPGH